MIYSCLADNIKYINRANRESRVVETGKYRHFKIPILIVVMGFKDNKKQYNLTKIRKYESKPLNPGY